ncbi:radical SAM/SPASM domain-containing protein [Afifella pfennigii]|uniref:radical SAM/SPASM domain-containing protein n=1 Tax=Afifella pfennigii TaxID=209897 RepID=UPI00047A21B4|nr:radical SAM protein [Afifella pfennigii]
MARWSSYNIFAPQEDGAALCFNARTGAILRLDAARYAEILREEDLDDDVFALFFEQGIIVEDDTDEIALIEARHEEARGDPSSLSITIELTEACNFRCAYCYQAHAKEHLTEEAERRIGLFLARKLDELSHLHINWFGGEPLTRLPVMRRLATRLAAQARESDCRVTQHVTTNGYLLTPDVAAELRELGIGNVQITLDGARAAHDASRPLASGLGSYERVLAGCRNVIDAGMELLVRINLTRLNCDTVEELLDDLIAHAITPDKAAIHVVRAVDHGNLGEGPASICFRNAEFAERWGRILESVAQRGFGTPSVSPIAYNCPFDLEQAVMIGRDASLRQCSSTDGVIAQIGPDGEEVKAGGAYQRIKTHRPTDDAGCRSCRFLPLCMGGCAYLRERGEEACNPERYIMPQLVTLYARQSSPQETERIGGNDG